MVSFKRQLLKPELASEFRRLASAKPEDDYRTLIFEYAVKAMRALSEGKSPRQAFETFSNDSTGHISACVAATITLYHSSGEKYRRWWNRYNEHSNIKGIVHPSLIVFDSKPRT